VKTYLDGRHYDRAAVLAGSAADVYDERGLVLAVRPGAVPADLRLRVSPALRRAATVSHNRSGLGGGRRDDLRGGLRSGVVGFFERSHGCRYCRATPFTLDDPAGWRDVVGLLREMDGIYRAALPHHHAQQRQYVNRIHPDFVVPHTVFTTASVNNTVCFRAHRDEHNLHLGASVMAVLRQGTYRGGLFVLPEWGLAVDAGDGDVLLFAADALHGNTAFVGAPGRFERLSVVAYCRPGLIEAGSAAEENARANRLAP
jgi:hypothetical protein